MKIYPALLILLLPFSLCAQNKLNFDKKFVQSEDKWVAMPADTSGAYPYGFVYIDPQAGLTLDYAGSFKIDATGKYIGTKRDGKSSMKYRLQPTKTLVAFIPENKLAELELKPQPDWLKPYKEDPQTTNYLYRRGFTYNAWRECDKALDFLTKAYQKEPEFKGLRTELAYTYNCLQRYKDAIAILQVAAQKEPLNSYITKELIYATVKNGAIDTAVSMYRNNLQKSTDKRYDAENAYNILSGYYSKKDKANFEKWLAETRLQDNKRFTKFIEQMKSELK